MSGDTVTQRTNVCGTSTLCRCCPMCFAEDNSLNWTEIVMLPQDMGIDKTFEERNDLIKFGLAKKNAEDHVQERLSGQDVGDVGCLEGKKITNHCPYSLIMELVVRSVKERMSFNMVEIKKEVNGN